jgi:hypothetical protein
VGVRRAPRLVPAMPSPASASVLLFTAWTLGARHAFDADHVSAINNVTRKLLSDGSLVVDPQKRARAGSNIAPGPCTMGKSFD